ncbi:heavy metal-associated isoprenylated plant protein 47-like [Juglans regia]|uniref:Heavy metal-associated isoprenylated plant protein 47-like n=2 Tax=Juglans regia TaxID=51240 RepID=A0A2I4DU95_JUGRE|nr:heavy metal-associated isoprenylated plant protein 47-like [Juglans regia]
MKQKIVIEVLPCDKCRSKALVLAAATDGVTSVTLDGQKTDQVVVVGDGVDAACLTKSLRKKVGYASLLTVEKVKETPEKKKEEAKKDPPPCARWTVPPCYHPQPEYYKVVYDPNPSSCALM